MCAIAGIINLDRIFTSDEMKHIVNKMASEMDHRGPDDSGAWVDPNGICAFSHKRLIVIDKSCDGHQPMMSADKNFCITYNGELYNYKELREELESEGYQFKTNSDTEVFLNSLIHYGDAAFKKLDGMYAFGLYNVKKRELIIGRDSFGEKPLYYTLQKGYFSFASEVQAFRDLPNFDDQIDDNSILQYLILQYIHSPYTIYKTVNKLQPGHYLKLSTDGTINIKKHFSFKPKIDYFDNRKIDDLVDELESILVTSIKRRMVSDVPLGAFLSGGVDSSLAVAIISKLLGHEIETYSIGFDSTQDTEHIYSNEIADYLGTNHNFRILKPDIVREVELIAKKLDEPNGDNSCLPTYLLARFAREKITVAISGDGGDELFGGYQRYIDTIEFNKEQCSSIFDKSLQSIEYYFNNTGIFIFNVSELEYLFGKKFEETINIIEGYKLIMSENDNNLINKMRQLDVKTYLPGAVLTKVDRMSMSNSLEVRTPYLNLDIANFAQKLKPEHCYKQGQGKYILRKLASRYLPQSWVTRKKRGFNFPLDIWARKELLDITKDIFFDSNSIIYNWLNKNLMMNYLDSNSSTTNLNPAKLWSLLILELWLRHNKT